MSTAYHVRSPQCAENIYLMLLHIRNLAHPDAMPTPMPVCMMRFGEMGDARWRKGNGGLRIEDGDRDVGDSGGGGGGNLSREV